MKTIFYISVTGLFLLIIVSRNFMFGSCPSREAALETFGKTSFDQLDTSVFKNGGLLDSGIVALHRNVTGLANSGIICTITRALSIALLFKAATALVTYII